MTIEQYKKYVLENKIIIQMRTLSELVNFINEDRLSIGRYIKYWMLPNEKMFITRGTYLGHFTIHYKKVRIEIEQTDIIYWKNDERIMCLDLKQAYEAKNPENLKEKIKKILEK